MGASARRRRSRRRVCSSAGIPADPAGLQARIQIEDRFPAVVLDDLVRRGHHFQKVGRKGELRYGYAAVLQFDNANGRIEAGAEPRRSHHAVAVTR